MNRPQYPRAAAAGGGQVAVLPEPHQVGALIVTGVKGFCRRHPVVSASFVLGWVVLVLVGSGSALTVQQYSQYNQIMNTIDLQAEYDAAGDYHRARQAYSASKGWFWSCDGTCQRLKGRMVDAEGQLTAIRREGQARMSDAKSVVGLWSEVGVGEVKDSFWQYFSAGKAFAKRQTMWDAFFMGMRQMSRGRDESWVEFGLKVLMQVLLNFSMGLVMALVMFVVGLWAVVRSYQPNPVVAVLFFLAATVAACSFVATYLLAVYGAAATGVYGVLKLAESSTRAQIANQQQQQRVQNQQQQQRGQRPHYD
jgi:ABC-type multidrug transport system fused ATPase/permease subunit